MNNQLIARRNFLSSSASALAGSALLPSFAKSAHRKGKLLYHTTEISNAEPVLSELVRNWMTQQMHSIFEATHLYPKSITIPFA